MDTKAEIKSLLDDLRKMGKDRRTIERELKYSEFYIDQALSKGGNEKLRQALEDYKNDLEKGSFDPHPTNYLEIINRNSIVMEKISNANYNSSETILDQQKLISTLTAALLYAEQPKKNVRHYKLPDESLLTQVNEKLEAYLSLHIHAGSAAVPSAENVNQGAAYSGFQQDKNRTSGRQSGI